MIISFRCPPKIKERVDALIVAGLYPDFSTFCVAALENQILLEDTYDKGQAQGVVVAKKSDTTSERPSGVFKEAKSPAHYNKGHEKIGTSPVPLTLLVSEGKGFKSDVTHSSPIPSKFDMAQLTEKPPFPLPSTYVDIFERDQEIPVGRWLFGQYNRLLPAKLSIRALAVIAMEGKDALLLEAVAPRIAEAGAQLGSYLRSLDRRFGIHRDDALSTAFPEEGVEGQKGRVRYQNHFVGHTVKGEQGGLLVGLKLAVIHMAKNKLHIVPTMAGWEFARLPNPLLDAPVSETPARFSKEEIVFLLHHIKGHVPAELFAYRVIISLISQGRNSPELVNQGLARYLSPGKKLVDEQDFVSTQRGGVMGRMTDLALVSRERCSTRITYHLTHEGKSFLEEIKPVPAVG